MRDKLFEQCICVKNYAEELKVMLNKYKVEYKEFQDKLDRAIKGLDIIILHAHGINAMMSSFTEAQLKDALDENKEVVEALETLIKIIKKIDDIDLKVELENLNKMIGETNQQYVM